MMGFCDSVIDFFMSMWTLITNFFQSLCMAVLLLSQSVTLTTYMIPFTFRLLGSCIISIIAIAVIKLLVGWGNQ